MFLSLFCTELSYSSFITFNIYLEIINDLADFEKKNKSWYILLGGRLRHHIIWSLQVVYILQKKSNYDTKINIWLYVILLGYLMPLKRFPTNDVSGKTGNIIFDRSLAHFDQKQWSRGNGVPVAARGGRRRAWRRSRTCHHSHRLYASITWEFRPYNIMKYYKNVDTMYITNYFRYRLIKKK